MLESQEVYDLGQGRGSSPLQVEMSCVSGIERESMSKKCLVSGNIRGSRVGLCVAERSSLTTSADLGSRTFLEPESIRMGEQGSQEADSII